jgi:hypothetical protein
VRRKASPPSQARALGVCSVRSFRSQCRSCDISFVTRRRIVPTTGLDEAREARDVVDRSWRGLFFFWEETPRGPTAAAAGSLTVPIMGKSDHIVEESLLHGGDVESHGIARPTRGSEDYIALPGPAAGAAESSEEGTVEYEGPERPKRSVALVLTICCAAAVLLGVGGFVSFNVINPNGGGLIEGAHPNAVLPKADGENEFYKASRTGYHFQPTNNWMNGEPNSLLPVPSNPVPSYHIPSKPIGSKKPELCIWMCQFVNRLSLILLCMYNLYVGMGFRQSASDLWWL